MQRRAIWIAIVFTSVMFLYTCRLIYLQIIPTTTIFQQHGSKYKYYDWRQGAVNQRMKKLMVDDGRGHFVDEHGFAITSEKYDTVAFFPVHAWKEIDGVRFNKLATILDKSPEQLQDFVRVLDSAAFLEDKSKVPIRLTEQQVHDIQALHLYGLEVVSYRDRYPEQYEQKHFIGAVAEYPEWTDKVYSSEIKQLNNWSRNSKVGILGLEYSLDRYLHGLGPSYLSYTLDGRYDLLSGIGMRRIESSNPYYPLTIITTIDLDLQNKIERYLDEQKVIEGAIVLLDVTNGDVKAMVSRPQLLPGQLSEGNDSVLRNHALTAYTPGSIYKIVTAAAALEYGVVEEDEHFYCNGEYGRYGLSCWKEGGHGDQTLEEAFANSCNVVFATLSERLTANQLYEIANALGVVQKVGWHQDEAKAPITSPIRLLAEEENGLVFHDLNTKDGGVIAQSSIGQRDVHLTPLQAANMVVTLLNRGRQYENRIVSQINYADGQVLAQLPVHLGHENKFNIHPATAGKILKYMQLVVQQGTGKSINEGRWHVAGKSGTAQLSGKQTGHNDQWFIGYGPTEKPQYALSVLVQEQTSGKRNQATQIFRGIMDIVAEHKQQ
ncbi:MAG: penicillin-binding transpeptidase domain-containing protein [Candidatus Pristimantibacillus lignocellulolyticus]|uniref:Penicillin-binding transpeptidase domain-containing protein n=1 Tax=Candidatus Pristimantibacillus lignocellulolyticus TaxID=2994561 RepID=A0A9J6Z9U2_9BACL|nr:MAG: penicillin-binding transpeptidase domain-containing protein [Candidatus Pristimantibacillus lignocellulolyticus]